jgi:hypothetical protein
MNRGFEKSVGVELAYDLGTANERHVYHKMAVAKIVSVGGSSCFYEGFVTSSANNSLILCSDTQLMDILLTS